MGSSVVLSSTSNMAGSTGVVPIYGSREDKQTGGGGGGISGRGGYSSGNIYPPDSKLADLVWEEKAKSLKDFVGTYRLPLVARVKTGDLSKFLPPCGPQQENAVQIHEVRRRKIVLARKLQWEKRQNDYIVSGEQVEVPASFKGWFEVVPDDGRPVEYFDTVGGICSVKPRRFLVRTSTVGYQLSMEDGASCWMPHEIRPGEVLTTGMVYMDNNNNHHQGSGGKRSKGGSSSSSVNSKGFFKRLLKSSKNKNKPEQDLKYLQCFDAEGKEIMIPLIMSGVFSPVGDASMANYDAVYELQDLIMAFGLPVNAQMIHANLKEKASCPQGVLRLYGTREEELAVLSRLEQDALVADPAVEKVEVPVDKDITLQRGLPSRKHSISGPRPAPISSPVKDPDHAEEEEPPDPVGGSSEVELPKRMPKELKKSKSTGILDKLSVRKVRKERAKLKELRSDDVFSRRLVRNDLSYEDFFNGLDGEEETDDKKNTKEVDNCGESVKSSSTSSDTVQSKSVYGSSLSSKKSSDVYGTGKSSIQDRDLPPIPVGSPLRSGRLDTSQSSKDSLYEHLPPAPQPPYRSHSDPSRARQMVEEALEDEEDGYMVPRNVRDRDSAYSSSMDVQLRHKPPAMPRGSRLKKSRSEVLPADLHSGFITADDGSSIDIDDLFNFTYAKGKGDQQYGTMAPGQWAGSTSRLYGYRTPDQRVSDAVPAWRAEVQRQRSLETGGGTLTRKSVERLNLETRSTKSGHHSRTQSNPNATIRSHNLRGPGNVMELFHFSDSFGDLRDHPATSSMSPHVMSSLPLQYVSRSAAPFTQYAARPIDMRGEQAYGAVTSPASRSPTYTTYVPRPQHYVAYADSEPAFRKSFHKASSVGGCSDSAYPKQGDDSAISMGSRGENPYAFQNDSEYSYNEYVDSGSGGTVRSREDCWLPPDDISALSVAEVSRSLRYIGMKDRVVLRFSNEQIDGSMLCSLDKRLLKEGFPELNALEIKKILDFVRGWRPKKR